MHSAIGVGARQVPEDVAIPRSVLGSSRSAPWPFVGPDDPAGVTVVVVSCQSAGDLPGVIRSLRTEAQDVRMRVIVADNASTDGSADVARNQPGVIVVETGGNLGYAAGINAAMSHAGDAQAVLVLNPDLTLDRGSVKSLLARLRMRPDVGIVVPKILDAAGTLYQSLRREPSLLRAAADAVLGRHRLARPEWLSEFVRNDREYLCARTTDWATGAAMLVDRSVWDLVGQWDERFFLYSEETDFFRRVRSAGFSVWYEPSATVRHRQGGSGTSDELTALAVANRLRYVEKHRPQGAALYRMIMIMHEEIRRGDRSHALSRRALWSRNRRELLPGSSLEAPMPADFPKASVIIPAHNEAAVIDRTLAPLAQLAAAGALEVIVSCNGCTDGTAARASRYPGVTVLETHKASKVAALNAADAVATRWPRLYLDADIEACPASLAGAIRSLSGDGIFAARPEYRNDTTGADAVVRSYYRARSRMPSMSEAMWGAGLYGLSRAGHQRLGAFPPLIADDLYVDQLFPPGRKRVVSGPAVVVRTPRTTRALLQVMTRARNGPAEQSIDTKGSTLRELVGTVTGFRTAVDAACYAALAVLARYLARRSMLAGGNTGRVTWERDDTTRVGADERS